MLKEIIEVFGNKPFLRNQAQAFEQIPLFMVYYIEKNEFEKNVKVVNRNKVPHDANIISIHVIFKVKLNDASTLRLTH